MQVAVIGGGDSTPDTYMMARELGKRLAEKGHIVICGGLGGIMEAVSWGAREAGGLVVAILPGEKTEANRYVQIAIATGMGHARNAIIVKSADVVIALSGEYGTLSEIALALKMNKKVICIRSWNISGTLSVEDLDDAMKLLNEVE